MKRVLSSCLIVLMLFSLYFVSLQIDVRENISIVDNSIPMSDGVANPAMDIVNDMGAGWNLGNSFCCTNGTAYGMKNPSYYENLWGNPVTTKTTIDAVKNQGFKTIRIPVTYKNHIDQNNIIEKQWLDRLKVVVDYVMEDDMYCIINIHHEDWLIADKDKQKAGEDKLATVWKQIAEYFSAYDEKLIFEGFNEVINSERQWDVAKKESYEVVNSYNQTFVNSVRQTGGANASRFLIVKPYAAKATTSVLEGFVLPKDSASNRLIVSAHIYDGPVNAVAKFDNLYNYFVAKGIPAIVGEWGNVSGPNNTEQARIRYARSILNISRELGIPCVWWDDGGIFTSSENVNNFAILQRKTGAWYFKDLADTIILESKAKDYKISSNQNINNVSDVFNMSNFTNWKTGDYSYVDGNYIASSTRICLKDEQKVVSGQTYTAYISDSRYHILIRVIDQNGKFVKTYNLADGDTFCIDQNNYSVRVSIYNYAQQNLCRSYDEYFSLFKSGFEAFIFSETFENPILATPNDDVFNMSNFLEWKSGNYSYKDGTYLEDISRICLKEYKPVMVGTQYKANISNENYKILVRFMNSQNKMIESHVLAKNDLITVPEGSVSAGISLYNSANSKLKFSDYEKLYADGFIAKLVEWTNVQNANLDVFNMKSFENWRTGNYSYQNGLYITDKSRICLKDYVIVNPNEVYIANISNNDYKILVRQLDKDNVMKESLILSDNNTFSIKEGIVKIGISIYNEKNSKMTFEDYNKLFANGFSVFLEKDN